MNIQNICIKNRLLVNVCHIVISSPWVIKLWEFSFSKLKIKTTPLFLISRNCVSHWKIPLFGEMGTSMDVYALVRTEGTGQAWGVPSGVLPPNLSPIWAVCIEMHGSCSTNDGTAVGQQRWEFSGAWPKVNQASGVPHQSWLQFD